MLAMLCSTAFREPSPISIMAMTAAMPMMIPSAVSAERSRLRRSARSGRRSARRTRPRERRPCGCARAGDRRRVGVGRAGPRATASRPLVFRDPAVVDADDALGVAGDVGVVRDQEDRQALGVELREQRQDLGAGSSSRGCRSARRRAASAGRLISARAMATRCCSPPDSCDGSCSSRSPSPTRSSSARARSIGAPLDRGAAVVALERQQHVVQGAGAGRRLKLWNTKPILRLRSRARAGRRAAPRPPGRRTSSGPTSAGRGSRGCS